MLMPKANRTKIYEYVFKEGVCVAKKDPHGKQHPHIEGVPNLHVMKAMQSLTSRGYVREQFAWRHYYWTLTDEGIEYLREYLHLPSEIVPATFKRSQPGGARPMARDMRQGGFPQKGAEADRDAYRTGEFDKQAEVGVGAGQMEFRAGFGRGAPKQ
jgi:small subunit ribosomal protein S10e